MSDYGDIAADGDAPLHQAARNGKAAAVRALLEAKANVNARTTDASGLGYTPAYLAAECNHTDTLQLLVAHGAAVNAANSYGETPLHVACLYGHSAAVRILLEARADVHAQSTDGFGNMPAHLAACNGHVECLQLLLDYRADPQGRDGRGRTPLTRAVGGHQLDTAMMLIRAGGDARTAVQYTNVTAMQLAAEKGSVDIIRELIEAKADVDPRDAFRSAPTHWAARGGHSEALRLLLEHKADVHATNNDGYTPLHDATSPDTAKVLLEHKANVHARSSDGFRNTPAHVAAWRGHAEVLRLLFEHGADICAKNARRRTPLQWALCERHLEAAIVAIEAGSTPHTTTTSLGIRPGFTVLHLAAQQGSMDGARRLLELKADVHAKDKNEHTALDIARSNGHTAVAQLLEEHLSGHSASPSQASSSSSSSSASLFAGAASSSHLDSASDLDGSTRTAVSSAEPS